MIIKCDLCEEELSEQGALFFSHPLSGYGGATSKWHIGRCCEMEVVEFFRDMQDRAAGIGEWSFEK